MDCPPVSVVIICCNAASTIQKAIRSAFALTDDVVVVDSGSTDGTVELISGTGAHLLKKEWEGYGANKNRGNSAARYDWVFSLDADEEISEELATSIKKRVGQGPYTVYAVKRLNYLGKQPILHGEWQNDWTIRLFNRTVVSWDASPVHEKLVMNSVKEVQNLKGVLHHYTAENIAVYKQKLDRYAALMGQRYYARGKKGYGVKMYLSPLFSFFKYYLVQMGWLDKKAGWEIARAHASYTYKKYKYLQELHKKKKSASINQ